jgi:hypothetical protein
MNVDKAYIYGLTIGGGVWGDSKNEFYIKLPYKKWGSLIENPQRASKISRDILHTVGNMFDAIYGFSVSYESEVLDEWRIICDGDITLLKEDLKKYGIVCEGVMRENFNLGSLVPALVDENLKRRFIAGLADTIGSTKESQRRFSDEVQIISFELKGFNFSAVCDFCQILHELKCYPDQLLWNHPNLHASSDPYYKPWKKGIKVRIKIEQYLKFGSFLFSSKAESAKENRQLQKKSHPAEPCMGIQLKIAPKCVHPAENYWRLPESICGGHYIHNRHVCATLGCPNAPKREVQSHFKKLGEYINPFPVLHKELLQHIQQLIENEPLYKNRKYTLDNTLNINSLIEDYYKNPHKLLLGSQPTIGYPLNAVLEGIAYVLADDTELFGKRIKKDLNSKRQIAYIQLIKRYLIKSEMPNIKILVPDLLTPLVIQGSTRGALVGPHNPKVYSRLISHDHSNCYKIYVRKITEKDLRNDR